MLNSDAFTLLTADSTLSGSFTNVLNGERLTTADGEGSFLVDCGGNDLVLSGYEAIPEPASLTLCVLGLVAIFVSWRQTLRPRSPSLG